MLTISQNSAIRATCDKFAENINNEIPASLVRCLKMCGIKIDMTPVQSFRVYGNYRGINTILCEHIKAAIKEGKITKYLNCTLKSSVDKFVSKNDIIYVITANDELFVPDQCNYICIYPNYMRVFRNNF